MLPNLREKVYQLTLAIPPGKVATYKQLAQLAGIKNPRLVGHYLHLNPKEGTIPCHRVVSSSGQLARNFAFGGAREQRKRLEKEGIKFIKATINLKEYLWQ